MKKLIMLLIVLSCCLAGCDRNLYLRTGEYTEGKINYTIPSLFEFSEVTMRLYRLKDDHWNLVSSFNSYDHFDNRPNNKPDFFYYDYDYTDEDEDGKEEPTAYFSFGSEDENGWSAVTSPLTLLTAEELEIYEKGDHGTRIPTNDEKDGLALDYNERAMAMTVFQYDEKYSEEIIDYFFLPTFHLYEIDPNDEFKLNGCYTFLITYQFTK